MSGRIAALISVFACIAGFAVVGLLGSTLLWFYAGYGIGTLGVLVLLFAAIAPRGLPSPDVHWIPRFAIVALVAFLARAFLAAHGPMLSFDLHWYADYVRFLQLHAVPYTAGFYFPYPQGFLEFLLPFTYARVPLASIHWTLIVVDCAVAVGVAAVVQRTADRSIGFWSGIAYALLPMAAIETGRIGHFETLVNACVLVLVAALQKRSAYWAAAAIAAATCLKAFPIALAPALVYTWRSKRRVFYSFIAATAAVALTLAPFWADLRNVGYFWFGRSSSSPGSAGAFTANSLPALAADVPFASLLLPLAEAAGLALAITIAVYGFRNARVDDRFLPNVGRLSLGVAAGVFFIYGCYCVARPWAASAYAYTWWTPTALSIGQGAALAGLAAIAEIALLRGRITLTPVQTLCASLAALLILTILVRDNVNPWYLMPVVALLFAAQPARVPILVLGCVCAFYASYNSSSFSTLGWNDVISEAGRWQTVRAAPGASVTANANNLLVQVSAAPPADTRSAVTLRAPLVAWTQPNTALAFDVYGDVDPTFHFAPFSFSAAVSGTTPDGRTQPPVTVHGDDPSATSIGPIHYRIPLFALPGGLNAIRQVSFTVRIANQSAGRHVLRIADVRAVNESRWDSWTAQATAAVLLLVAISLAIVYRAAREE